MTYVLVLAQCFLKWPKLLGSLKSPPMPVEGDRCKPEATCHFVTCGESMWVVSMKFALNIFEIQVLDSTGQWTKHDQAWPSPRHSNSDFACASVKSWTEKLQKDAKGMKRIATATLWNSLNMLGLHQLVPWIQFINHDSPVLSSIQLASAHSSLNGFFRCNTLQKLKTLEWKRASATSLVWFAFPWVVSSNHSNPRISTPQEFRYGRRTCSAAWSCCHISFVRPPGACHTAQATRANKHPVLVNLVDKLHHSQSESWLSAETVLRYTETAAHSTNMMLFFSLRT